MITNPEKFVLHSGIKYHKILAKGVADTTSSTGTVVLMSGVPEGATWLIGFYSKPTSGEAQMTAGPWGYVKPNGDLCVDIQRQAPVTSEKWYWRVYAD